MKQGELVLWLVGGPGPDYDMAIFLNGDEENCEVLFQVYGEGRFHTAKITDALSGNYKKVMPINRQLCDWERERYKNLILVSEIMEEAAKNAL